MKRLVIILSLVALLLLLQSAVFTSSVYPGRLSSATRAHAATTTPDPNSPYGMTMIGNTGFGVTDSNGHSIAAQDFHTLGLTWARVQIDWSFYLNVKSGTLPDLTNPANYTWTALDNTLTYASVLWLFRIFRALVTTLIRK